jgi:predicted site-specific integrase-resolvase
MGYAGNGKHRAAGEIRLYTLTEVAESINVSMPTAQRYKRYYQSRIPAVGLGRKQRYPREALKVFEQIKLENLSKRGRPAKELKSRATTPKRQTRKRTSSPTRKKAKTAKRARTRKRSVSRRKAAMAVKAKPTRLLTLTEISQKTGISYPTCINYVKRHLDRIPHVGTGRRRRFPPEAVTVFRELRNQSRSGRRKGTATSSSRTDKAVLRRLRELERSQRQLVRQLESVLKVLNSPLNVTIKRG